MLSNEFINIGLTVRLNKKLTAWGIKTLKDLKTKELPKVGEKVYKNFYYNDEVFRQKDIHSKEVEL